MTRPLFGRSVEHAQSPTRTPSLAPAGKAPTTPALAEAQFNALVRAHYGKLCGFAYRFVESEAIAE
jgi:hypothetical protein